MIPTRLSQKFKSGTLHGFNRETGSLLVVYPGIYFSDELSACSTFNAIHECVNNLSTPTCNWNVPTNVDIDSFIESLACNYNERYLPILRMLEWNIVREYLYTSKFFDSVLIMQLVSFELSSNQLKFISSRSTRAMLATDGLLVPVHYINGNSFD